MHLFCFHITVYLLIIGIVVLSRFIQGIHSEASALVVVHPQQCSAPLQFSRLPWSLPLEFSGEEPRTILKNRESVAYKKEYCKAEIDKICGCNKMDCDKTCYKQSQAGKVR